MKSLKFKIFLLGALSSCLLVTWLLITRSQADRFVVKFGYWLLLAGSSVYAVQLCRYFREKMYPGLWPKYRMGLGVAIFGAVFLQIHEPRQFKVLLDEFAISGVARNMHFQREASYPTKAHYINSQLQVDESATDKRPLFFQFLLSVMHDLTGYRPQNVFLLNGFLAFALLLMTYYFGMAYGGWQLAVTLCALWAGFPLLAQNATGGGFDLCNIVMILTLWFFAREYLRTPTMLIQSLLVLTAVLLAQTRYESLIYVAVAAAVIVCQWKRQRSLQLGWSAAILPVYLSLPFAINIVFAKTPAFFQTGPAQAFFSIDYLSENIGRAIWYLFNLDFNATNSPVLAAVGVVALVAFVVKMASFRRLLVVQGDDIVLVLIFLVIMVTTVLGLGTFWGQWDDPMATRFCLPLHLAFVLCIARVLREFRGAKLVKVWTPILSVIVMLALAPPVSARAGATREMLPAQEYAWFLKQLDDPKYAMALIVAHPEGPILFNHAAISLTVAERAPWKIGECLKNGVYRDIIVLERLAIDSQTLEEIPYSRISHLEVKNLEGSTADRTLLGTAFKKQVVAEVRFRPNVISRISRIVGVDGPLAQPPEKYREAGPPFPTQTDHVLHIYSALP